MLYSIAQSMKPENVSKVQSLEKELGRYVLAFSSHSLNHSNLSSGELERLQELEKELGVTLVAVKDSQSSD